jgi:hypothetical protein
MHKQDASRMRALIHHLQISGARARETGCHERVVRAAVTAGEEVRAPPRAPRCFHANVHRGRVSKRAARRAAPLGAAARRLS